jgi:hypothetical protein
VGLEVTLTKRHMNLVGNSYLYTQCQGFCGVEDKMLLSVQA